MYGKYKKDTIVFKVYDHYGYPEFADYKTVMLFVSEENGNYYHEKYQFFDVYRTTNDKWASPYSIYDYKHSENEDTHIKPVKLNFVEEVSYATTGIYLNGDTWTRDYPKPHYKTIGKKAIAIYGNYVPELFKLKRNGVLTARGLF